MLSQLPLFPQLTAKFPSTRYQGSKAKLVDWLWEQVASLPFDTALDAFGGTGAVAYRLKQAGKSVTYNDVLRFNHLIGKALIENGEIQLTESDIDWLVHPHPEIAYPDFIQQNFQDIYFTEAENIWLDQIVTNMHQISDPYKYALAFFALSQACIVKRPYNLFHRKNLYIRFAEVERSFGNKTSWDKPFEEWFRFFAVEANAAIFDNQQPNYSLNEDAGTIEGDFDLVYIDPPYISSKGVATDYHAFYHFLEGLTMYDQWGEHIDLRSKHRRLKGQNNPWTNKHLIEGAFEKLFAHFQDSILVVSYRKDGIPSEERLVRLLKRYKPHVRVEHFGQYKYALSTNAESGEMLLIGT
jgi:adenine-specific DNA methylase